MWDVKRAFDIMYLAFILHSDKNLIFHPSEHQFKTRQGLILSAAGKITAVHLSKSIRVCIVTIFVLTVARHFPPARLICKTIHNFEL